MQIRRARITEAEALSRIALESKAHWGYSAPQLALWREDLSISADLLVALPGYVLEMEGRVAGFHVLRPSSRHWLLEHLWVLPAQMGRGIGRALLEHAADVAAKGGATGLEIDADPGAEPFYRACGAVRSGSVPAPIDGAPDCVRPQLVLALDGTPLSTWTADP